MSKQRGLTAEQIRYITDHKQLHELIKREELFFGVRNGYFNLYYQGASAGECRFQETGGLSIATHEKYLGKDGKNYKSLSLEEFLTKCNGILLDIERVQSTGKNLREKPAQQALILANNRNENSRWYCVDLEYVQEPEDKSKSKFGRFDIVAVSRTAGKEGRHRVALIELKAGYKTAYPSNFPKKENAWLRKQIDDQAFSVYDYEGSLGSGIVGHLADFCRFERAGQFEKLKEEVCEILSNKRALDFEIPCPELRPKDLEERPHFYFLTLSRDDASQPVASCKKSMSHHLGSKAPVQYNAKKVLGETFLERENYHFLFAPGEMGKRKKVDILCEPDIERLE